MGSGTIGLVEISSSWDLALVARVEICRIMFDMLTRVHFPRICIGMTFTKEACEISTLPSPIALTMPV